MPSTTHRVQSALRHIQHVHGAGTAKLTVGGEPPRFLHPLPDVVTTRGGEYFWMPSMAALRALRALHRA